MKIISRFFVVVCLHIVLTSSLQAQILDRFSRSIDRAINNEVGKLSDKIAERMVERIIERALAGESTDTDSLATYMDSEASDSTSENTTLDLSGIFGSSSKKIEKTFDFDYKLKTRVNNGKQSDSYDIFLPKQGTYSAMQINDIFVIIDYETGESYTIMNDDLIRVNMTRLIEKMNSQIDMEESGSTPTVTKTGRAEIIAGYQCDEYIMENDDHHVEAWISQDFIGQDIRNAAIIKMLNKQYEGTDAQAGGYALKIISSEKGSKDVTTMIVESISEELKTVDLSQY